MIIVIGGGHNGLTAAITLAKKGHRVTVVEAKEQIGGIAGKHVFGAGYVVPGLLHDTRGVRQEIVKDLGLEKHGLRRKKADPICAPIEGEDCLWIHEDKLEGAISESDQQQYKRYRQFIDHISPLMLSMMSKPPLSPESGVLSLLKTGLGLRRLGAAEMTELVRITPMCVADLMRDRFANERLGAALALPATAESFVGPWSGGTVGNLLLQEATASDEIEGGSASLIAALEKAAIAAGVTIKTASLVTEINCSKGKATGVTLSNGEIISASAVFSSCDPKQTFERLIKEVELPLSLIEDVHKIRCRATIGKLHLGLKSRLKLADGTEPTRLRTGETLNEIERAFDPMKYSQFSRKPVLDVRVYPCEGELAQKGHCVASIMIHYVPFSIEGGWSEENRRILIAAVIEELSRYCGDVEALIEATELLTPEDLSNQFHLTGGHLFHGEMVIDQLLFMRPTVECSDYKTPIEGLYLCGSGSHPAGGITAAPGWLAARAL